VPLRSRACVTRPAARGECERDGYCKDDRQTAFHADGTIIALDPERNIGGNAAKNLHRELANVDGRYRRNAPKELAMQNQHSTRNHHYGHLAIMAVLSFIAMYILMYAMVDRFDNVFNNVNQAYMAALMAAPMVMIELAVMRSMYRNRMLNLACYAASAIVLIASFLLIRQQTAVGDTQFVKSMIPHHAGAVLMCEKAQLSDPELKNLCKTIITGQNAEIAQMKAKLAALEKSKQAAAVQR
jgi:hypothetical protein